MKKIGVLTFHRAINYGAVLQCYALQQQISDLGFNVEVIDYASKDVYSVYKKTIFHFKKNEKKIVKLLKIIKRNIFYVTLLVKRKKMFNFIKKEVKLSEKYTNKEKLVKKIFAYDVFVTGSDQVWNEVITLDDAEVYNLKAFNNVIKVGYGVSIGEDKPSRLFIRNLKNSISDYSNIGVREESIIKTLDLKAAIQVLDPTLLIDSEQWKKLIPVKISKKTPNKYIFVYMIEVNALLISAVNDFSKKTGLPIINLGYKSVFENEIKTIKNISPYEFLNYFNNANYIVTDSFHGICFSVIFGKQFISVLNPGRSGRQVELLKLLNLSQRIYNDKEDINRFIEEKIDYEKVGEIINNKRKQSVDFLINSFKEKK